MPSSTKQSEHECSPSSKINFAKSLSQYVKSKLQIGHETVSPTVQGVQAHFTIAMDDIYDYKIAANEFDPETTFSDITTLGYQLSVVLQNQLTPGQQTSFDAYTRSPCGYGLWFQHDRARRKWL
ncbi:hypothetical protein N7451_000504 [Penicillium sp. IBT 35674x]|nr:hypothetical protein N7451_000504 [Penicillium sp. IBT 35674x]